MFDTEKVEKYFPEAGELMWEPMLIWKFPAGREEQLIDACNSGDYFASLKKDGACYQFVRTPHYSYLFGRKVSTTNGLLTEKIDNVPHIKEALSCLPPNSVLLTEIYYPGTSSNATVSIMGCLPEKAIERQKGNPIHCYIHDILYYNGVDLREKGALMRYKMLDKVWHKHQLYKYPFLELAEPIYENIWEEASKALARGEEGLVLRKKDGLYFPGKRPARVTAKIKKLDNLELVCIGFSKARAEYTGKDIENWPYWALKVPERVVVNQCKYGNDAYVPVTKYYYYGYNTAIEVGAYDKDGTIVKVGTVSSGMTDELRKDTTEHPEKYLNKVCSIRCMSKNIESRTLRHPVFIGWRPDKNDKECLIDEIFPS